MSYRVSPWAGYACLSVIFAAVTLSGCQRTDGAKAATAAAAPPPVAVHMVKVEPRSVPIRFTVPGVVEGSKEVEVRARVSGILQKQFYREGDPVRQGAPLFEIDRAPYEVALAQAKAQLTQAAARADQAEARGNALEAARRRPGGQPQGIRRRDFGAAAGGRGAAAGEGRRASKPSSTCRTRASTRRSPASPAGRRTRSAR